MPKLSTKPAAEPKKNGKAKVTVKGAENIARKIKYSEVRCVLYLANNDKGTLMAELAMKLLGWENEKEFAARLMKENPALTEDACTFEKAGITPLCKDEDGINVFCWNNVGNREFDDERSKGYTQDILERKWADSRNGADMTINGESIVITNTGRIDSGQKRLVAVVRAKQKWLKNPKKYDKWQTEPSIEALVVVGISENPLVTQTIDNVSPRSLEDVLFTSHTFADLKSVSDKREIVRMTAKATESLFGRVGAGGEKGNKTYQTHSASLDFLARHKRLEKYVKHVYEENKNRSISLLKLSPGEMAAACWLMASGQSDGDAYRNALPPSEKGLNFDNEGRAMGFFVELVHAARNKGVDKKLAAVPLTVVVEALGNLADDDTGMGGRKVEKLAILARAWAWWHKQDATAIIPPDVVDLKYHKDDMGMVHLLPDEDGYLNWFGGCDIGERVKQGKTPAANDGDDPADDDDMEARKESAKRETSEEAQRALDEKKAKLAANRKKREEAGQPNGTGAVPTPKIGK